MTYYYPNRPILVPPDPANPFYPARTYLDSLEKSGRWVAEKKMNGDNTLIYTDDLSLWNRHHARLKTYQPSGETLAELKKFPKGCILNAETMNSKTKGIKDILIVHCVMAWEGQLLNGKTWGDSRLILEKYWHKGGYGANSHVVLSETFKTGFWDLFQAADVTNIEGIILKDPTGLLKFSATPLPDVPWMRKIRKPCKKYSF